jgi:hypothetical protein
MIVRAMKTTIWTCCTSFVLRVMSEALPKWLISGWEKLATRLKIAPRTSRPKDMATREPK